MVGRISVRPLGCLCRLRIRTSNAGARSTDTLLWLPGWRSPRNASSGHAGETRSAILRALTGNRAALVL